MGKLTHFDKEGRARMVDVGAKTPTRRIAVVSGKVIMKPDTLKRIIDKQIEKGDVFGIARVAGIMKTAPQTGGAGFEPKRCPGAWLSLVALELCDLAESPPPGAVSLPPPLHTRLVVELALSHVSDDALANALALEAPERLLEGLLIRHLDAHRNEHPFVWHRSGSPPGSTGQARASLIPTRH